MRTIGLDIPIDDPCSFCSYLEGDQPYTIVRRSDLVATFVTREQRGLPHLLVIPVQHRETILDLTDDEAAAVMREARDAARAIDTAFARPGIAVWQNNGVAAWQSIPHLHLHVAGTLEAGGTEWGPVQTIPVAATDEIAERIRAAWPA